MNVVLIRCVWLLAVLIGTARAAGAEQLTREKPGIPSAELNHIFKSGEDGYDCFRIPAIVTTNRGTLLAFAEGRRNGCGDSGDIDLVMKRSDDHGRTWGRLQLIWSDSVNTCGNPSPLVDKASGRIFLLSTWNRGEDHEKEIIALTSKDTRRVFVLSSDDDGKVWSAAKEITSTAKDPNTSWYATGPGHGIQILNGKYKDRLVVPVNQIDKTTKKDYVSTIYSDDRGRSWTLGSRTPQDLVNECTVVEIDGGRLMVNMRNYDRSIKTRKVSLSDDGGTTWSNVFVDEALIEPICQAALLRYPVGRKKFSVLFSNPASLTTRTNMTLRLSEDGGRSWRYSKQIHSGPSAYSDMTVLRNGEIGVLFEGGVQKPYEGIAFVALPYKELKR